MSIRKKVRASVIEMWSRLTDYKPEERVYLNGDDNQYPEEMERGINNSPTGSRSANMLAKYIAGESVEDDTVINEITMAKKSDLVRAISVDVSKQNGCWIHVSYAVNKEGKLYTTNPKVLDYKKCRKDKEDDDGFAGKIYFKDYRKDKKAKFSSSKNKDDKKWYYPFNNNEEVIISQIKNDAKIAKKEINAEGDTVEELSSVIGNYRGQVYYLNLTPEFVYAVSLFDSVFNDLDTEYRVSLYTNSSWRTGFLGKLAVITSGIDDEDIAEVDENIENWLGAEDASNIFRLDVETTEDISKVLHVQQIKSQYDEKQSIETRKNCRQNIMGAANNIPEMLVFNSSGLFAQGGEAYRENKKFYSEQTEYERSKVEATMNLLGFPTKIVPLYVPKDEEEEETK